MFSSAYAKEKAENRKALYTILSTIRFLAWQGLPLQESFAGYGSGESKVISCNYRTAGFFEGCISRE